jgi:hypothetical protein
MELFNCMVWQAGPRRVLQCLGVSETIDNDENEPVFIRSEADFESAT